MKTLSLDELWRTAEVRLHDLGYDTAEWQDRLRNKGEMRTPDKRYMLARLQERARDAGLEPLASH